MSEFARPALSEIYHVLAAHRALIVHCSGTPKGAGSNFEEPFPLDLAAVVAGKCQTGLSCSTVMPGDEFGDFNTANATGCVGVVLGLRSAQSLRDAHPRDCGSFMENGVRQVPRARDMAAADIDATISCRPRDAYNEWVIADFTVIGFFAAAPFRISAQVPVDFPDDVPDYLRGDETAPGFKSTSPDELAALAPELPVFSFVGVDLVSWVGGRWEQVDHSDVYF